MEWVEITAKTIEEARELAIDKLGVDETEVEVEVIEEPKQGLFGRTRGQARLRARVEPRSPRAKSDRRDGRRKNGSGGKASGASRPKRQPKAESAKSNSAANDRAAETKAAPKAKRAPRESREVESASVEEVRETVSGFLAGLTSAFGYDSAVSIPEDDDAVNAMIDGKHGLMVGPKARTLDAIQELTRVVAQRSTPSSVRIRLDVGGYREARRTALQEFAVEVAQQSTEGNVEVVLEPMSSADRKILHDALGEQDGVTTRSAGSEPRRRVVVVPDGDVELDDTEGDEEE